MLTTLLLLLKVTGAVLPNPVLTPGAVRPLSLQTVCQTKWGTDRRHVPDSMKKQVLASYGMRWEDRGQVEIDHLVPRSLLGADDILNLFPQCCRKNGVAIGPAHTKDVLENRLHRLVCSGKLSLGMAQEAIRTNWIEANERY